MGTPDNMYLQRLGRVGSHRCLRERVSAGRGEAGGKR